MRKLEPFGWLTTVHRGLTTPLLMAVLCALGLVSLLVWPLPLQIDQRTVTGPFHDGHVWCFWQMKQILMGDAGLQTSGIGWPTTVNVQLIGWAPGILVAPLQDVIGPVGAYNASLFITTALNVIFGALLCRSLVAKAGSAAAGGLILALCPYALDALANGQVVKLQIWVLIVHLLVVRSCTRGWWRLPLVIPASLMLAFTSPSLAMALPFALMALVPTFVMLSPRPKLAIATGSLSIALTAMSLVGASRYYDLEPHEMDRSAFFPANVRPGDYDALLEQIARIDSLFLGGVPQGFHADHIPYLGIAAVVIAIVCSVRGYPGRLAAWCLIVVGVLLALGPRLANSAGFVLFDGQPVALPAAWLEAAEYPVVRSGMYHRFLVLASVGLAIIVSCGTTRWKRYGVGLSWAFALVLAADALFQSKERWPLDTENIPGLASYTEMASDPEPGAVVILPLRINDVGGGTQIMLSTLHERPTTGLPRYDYWQRSEAPGVLLALFDEASEPGVDPEAFLSEAGIRYVLWAPWIGHGDGGPDLDVLTTLLGEPRIDGVLRWWRIAE